MLSSAFGAVLGSTGTICGVPSTTVTGTLITVVFSSPLTVYLTVTGTSPSSVNAGISPTVILSLSNVTPSGSLFV